MCWSGALKPNQFSLQFVGDSTSPPGESRFSSERWSDGPPLFPDLPPLLSVVDLLLGSALEERERKSD